MINPEDKKIGRPKGSINKKSALAADRVALFEEKYATFVSPFDFLLLTMNGIDQDGKFIEVELRERIDCAKTAVQYTNAKLTSTEMRIESNPDDLEELSNAAKRSKIEQLLNSPSVKALLLDAEGDNDDSSRPE